MDRNTNWVFVDPATLYVACRSEEWWNLKFFVNCVELLSHTMFFWIAKSSGGAIVSIADQSACYC
jgi:hypothetical protein